jgi:hypothetical protein
MEPDIYWFEELDDYVTVRLKNHYVVLCLITDVDRITAAINKINLAGSIAIAGPKIKYQLVFK